MPDIEAISDQQELLQVYRRNLAYLLRQQAQYGGAVNTPLSVANGIYEARDSIRRIKNILRTWDIDVDDLSDDKELEETKTQIDSQVINTSGGDYAERNIDKRQGVFIEGGRIYGPVVGVNFGETIYSSGIVSSSQIDDNQRQELRESLRAHTSRLRVLELQQASQGIHTLPHIIIEIADIQSAIARLNAELVATQPVVDRSELRQLRGQAFKAFYRKDWIVAENLLSQILIADPNDEDVWVKLHTVQQQLNVLALYQAIRELRDEHLWQGVLDALDDLDDKYPNTSDTESLRFWAEMCKQREERYAVALAAYDREDWRLILNILDDLSREQEENYDPKNLRDWAEGRQNTERCNIVIAALETILSNDHGNKIAQELLNRLRTT